MIIKQELSEFDQGYRKALLDLLEPYFVYQNENYRTLINEQLTLELLKYISKRYNDYSKIYIFFQDKELTTEENIKKYILNSLSCLSYQLTTEENIKKFIPKRSSLGPPVQIKNVKGDKYCLVFNERGKSSNNLYILFEHL